MSESRFTAQEMREVAEGLVDSCVADYISILVGHGNLKVVKGDRIVAMLRQAADAEDELVQLRASKERWMQYQETAAGERNACIDELREKDAEIAQFKARLEAVVKECEKSIFSISQLDFRNAILRAARGEGGAK